MAQHDYVIDNSTGANVRSDINSVLQAIASNNSGSSAPSTAFATQFFADTSAGIMKLRNTSNNGYVNLFTLAGGIDVDAASNFNEDVTFTGASANILFDKSADALHFDDNAVAKFGSASGGDLKIFHDGSNSIIQDNGTGELILQRSSDPILKLNSSGIEVLDPSGAAEVKITAFEGSNAQIKLAADEGDDNGDTWLIQSIASTNAFRFLNDISGSQTTKWTLDTDGNVTQTGDLDLVDAKKIKLGNSNDLEIYHSGSESFIADEGTGGITISSNLISLKNATRDETLATMTAGSSVELYEDNELRFETTGSGAKISRNSDGDNVVLLVTNLSTNSSSDSIIRLTVSGTTQHTSIHFADSADSDAGEIDYDHDNNLFVFRVSGTDRFNMSTGAIHPVVDDLRDIGTGSLRFDDIRASNGTIQTSDRNEKNSIVASDLGLDFINKLSPVSYKFNNKTRTHYGLIAQDIETLLGTLSKTATDFAGFCKDEITTKTEMDDDGHAKEIVLETPFDRYGLRYNEFIAPIIKAIQELSAKVTALESA